MIRVDKTSAPWVQLALKIVQVVGPKRNLVISRGHPVFARIEIRRAPRDFPE